MQQTTEKDRQDITARLFRRESVGDIAKITGFSKKTIWRISHSLRTFGTALAPKEEQKRGRKTILTDEEHEGLAQFVLGNPIAVLSDMIDFVRDKYGKEVNQSCVCHAIKRQGFSRIIIMRGHTAERHDLPPEAARVHHIAHEAIEEQGRLHREKELQEDKKTAQNRGRYAWVRLHPGEETGFNPRKESASSKRKNNMPNTEPASTPLESLSLPDISPVESYISPYTQTST